MVHDLQTFNYDQETNAGLLPKSSASISSGRYSVANKNVYKDVFTEEYVVQDGKRVPQNQIETIEKRLIKMNRLLQAKFPNQQAFEKSLQASAGEDANGNLNVDDFKSYLVEQCRSELIARKVTKQDIEGFMSAFVFNNHGGTDITQVAPLVYETD